MNIQEAKETIKRTVSAYLTKDEVGNYMIPRERQRPILLMGPPGIGKTAIMEQVARECNINLVAYTMTHHTRQSAIGLPFISQKKFGEETYSVTEYTMSEIIASVHEQIELSGIKEGILFLDEINCVSETLAPTMLQFLQYKTFGAHRVPDGFLIVCAGNPPKYNKSVRDFDLVTLDRLKKITVEAEYNTWKAYAYKRGIHGSIMAYLEIKKEHFYSIRAEIEETYFVTARGWEDLSQILYAYEKLHLPIDFNLAVQYIQDPEIAEDFAIYYELYRKYRKVYQIPEILEGSAKENEELKNAPFDERLSLLSLLIDSLNSEFKIYTTDLAITTELFSILSKWKEKKEISSGVAAEMQRIKAELDQNKKANLYSTDQIYQYGKVLSLLEELYRELSLKEDTFETVQRWFGDMEEHRQMRITKAGEHLSNSFSYLAKTFGENQEMVIFLSELANGYYSLKYVSDCGNEAYYKYNRLLLLQDRKTELRNRLLSL